MTKPKKPHGCIVAFQRFFSGCLAILATGFLAIIIFFLSSEVKIEGMSLLILAISGFFVLRYLWKKVGRKSTSNVAAFKHILYDLLRTVAVFVLFSVIMAILMKNAGYTGETKIIEEDTSQTEVVETTEGDSTIKYIINKLRWRDFDGDWYRMNFKIAENSVKKSKTNRNGYQYTRNFTE